MLKNKFNTIKIKNFFKAGMFGDFFLKKLALKLLLINNKYSVLFLEKFILEFVPKNIHKLTTLNTQNNSMLTSFLSIFFCLLNLILTIFLFFWFSFLW